MKELLFVALVLACPLMMIWMMRGHGHGGRGSHIEGDGVRGDTGSEPRSLADLRRDRDEIDRLIEERTADEEAGSLSAGSTMSNAELADDAGHRAQAS